MDQGGTTWIVTATSSAARVYEERTRAGGLREIAELRMHAESTDRVGRGQQATVHQRVGDGRHAAGEKDPRHRSEARFLNRVAHRLAESATRGEFETLVIMAPPHALGALRAALPAFVLARVEASDPHDRSSDDEGALRAHLRDARAR